jgi:hypothetical protein
MSAWTDEKIAALSDLHKRGFSFSHIAGEVGMTRNACIGRANRMGLKSDKPKVEQRPKRARVHVVTHELIDIMREVAERQGTKSDAIIIYVKRFPDRVAPAFGTVSSIASSLKIRFGGLREQAWASNQWRQTIAPAAPVPIVERFPARANKGVKLVNLEPDMCRWPLGEGRAVLFCGDAKMRARSYCRDHFVLSCNPMWIDSTREGRAIKRELANV